MKNNFTISQRNAIVENHLWCVNAVMKQNRALIRAAKLDADDVKLPFGSCGLFASGHKKKGDTA